MVQVIDQSSKNKSNKSKGQTVPATEVVNTPVKSETVPTVESVEANNVPTTETINTSETNGENTMSTATVPTVEATVPSTSPVNATGEKLKRVPLSQYKEECKGGFNMSEYLRSLIEKDADITTEDALIALENDHPRLVVKKEAFGVVLSNLKSKERNKDNPDSPASGRKGKSSEVTLEDVVKAKELVKSNGGLDSLLAALESYRAFKVLTDALGGEEKTVKILTMMDELRKE